MEAKERMLKFVEKLANKQPVTEVEVKEFIVDLVRNNPYVTNLNYPAIGFKDRSPLGEMAKFSQIEGITVTNEFVADVVSGKMGLTDILNTVGHEYTHFLQTTDYKEIETKNTTLKEYCKEVTRAWEIELLSPEQINEIVQTLAICTDNEYFQELQAKSPEEKKELIGKIAFADYLHAKHEEDARLGGISYSTQMLEEFLKDFSGNINMETFINSQQQEMDRHVNNFMKDETKYPIIEEFEKHLQNITINVLRDLEDEYKIILTNNLNAEWSGASDKEMEEKKEYENLKLAILNKTVDYFCETKSIEDLTLIYKAELNRGRGYICGAIDDFIFNKSRFLDNEKQFFQNSVYEMIMGDNYKDKIFTPSYLFTSALSGSQLKGIVKKYVKEKDLARLSNISLGLFHNSKNYEQNVKTIMFNFDNIMPLIQQVNYKLEKGKPVTKEDYHNCLHIVEELQRELKLVKTNEHVQNMLNEINRISQSLELYSDMYQEQVTSLDNNIELDPLLNEETQRNHNNVNTTNGQEMEL